MSESSVRLPSPTRCVETEKYTYVFYLSQFIVFPSSACSPRSLNEIAAKSRDMPGAFNVKSSHVSSGWTKVDGEARRTRCLPLGGCHVWPFRVVSDDGGEVSGRRGGGGGGGALNVNSVTKSSSRFYADGPTLLCRPQPPSGSVESPAVHRYDRAETSSRRIDYSTSFSTFRIIPISIFRF